MYYIVYPFRQNKYNRENAVNYAVKYALTPNFEYKFFPIISNKGGDCTNFISQCLKAGGGQMSYSPKNAWWYKNYGTLNKSQDTCSVSWSLAHALYWYLKTNKGSLKGSEVTDINYLELGDLIFYEDFNNKVTHSTIITSFIFKNGFKEPLISQHSYNGLNITYKKNTPYKKMHFVKIDISS